MSKTTIERIREIQTREAKPVSPAPEQLAKHKKDSAKPDGLESLPVVESMEPERAGGWRCQYRPVPPALQDGQAFKFTDPLLREMAAAGFDQDYLELLELRFKS